MAHQARNRKSIRGNHFLLHTIRAKRNLENLEEGGGLYSKIFGKSHKEEYSGQEGLAEMDEINRYNMEEAILPRLARKLTKKLVNKLLKRGGSFTPEEHLEVKRRTGFHINEIRHKIQRHYAN